MKYIFIVNQKSGNGRCEKILPNIEESCKKRNIEYEIRTISEEKSGADIAKEYKDEENVIYVVGGDGTIKHTLPGLVNTKNKLGIIPAGSGNDTYRVVKNLQQGDSLIDIGKINDTYFINVACSGIDAEVANNLDRFRNTFIPTSQIYNASIVYTLFNFRSKKVEIRMPAKTIKDKYTLLSICNGAFYGGGFNIAPKSKLNDGLFDIYYAEKMSLFRLIPLLLKLKKGIHEGKRKVHKYRTNHMEVNFEEEVTFNVDGEKLQGKNFEITVLSEAIKIFNDDDFVKEIMEQNLQKANNKKEVKV